MGLLHVTSVKEPQVNVKKFQGMETTRTLRALDSSAPRMKHTQALNPSTPA